ncbi:MAG: hypothetical protein GY945_04335 [Rhodobacteraceae bacterium]|nr:hypothetical protein [Paracoccaceae bacterium]
MTRTFSLAIMRPLIALSLAASIVLSPVSATPAQAGNNNADNFIAALVALGLIGIIIENNNGRGDPARHVSRSKRLPASCLKEYDLRHGRDKTLFSERCLRRNFRFFHSLPDQCAEKIRARTNHGRMRNHKVYRPRCLSRKGYVVAHRR